MTIKFRGEGQIGQGKKKVLSNKSLTRRVRGLSGKEGKRESAGDESFIDGITLAANVGQVFYLAGLNSVVESKIHTVRFFIRWQSIINSCNRIIVFEDIRPAQGNVVIGGILFEASINSLYTVGAQGVHPFSAKRLNKNVGDKHRIRILKDMMWADAEPIADVDIVKLFRFDLNLRGRRSSAGLSWGMVIISDKANTPIDVQYQYDYTDLKE